ncbi:MAG: HTH domain-containing protein [Eubacteriales bacterium]|nr:HTH domain-containing protein [Eubacteriales bacterium]
MSSKEEVLAFLEKNKEKFCSGAYMASELGISRNAVWKAVNGLKKEGYAIEAVTNRGYRLVPGSPDNDRLSVQGLAPYLPEAYLGRIHIYESLPSTNRTAKELAVGGAEDGTVVIANGQTAGSGHADHSFFSPAGGIYMSVVRRPGKLATACGQESVWTESGEEAARADGQKSADLAGAGSHPAMLQGFVPSGNSKNITYMTAKLVADVIRDVTGISVRVRPVNDLYVGEKKVGGILTEAGSDFDTGELQWLVIGIGINVSTPADAFPAEIRERAGSLYPDGHALVTRNELVAAIISRLLEA